MSFVYGTLIVTTLLSLVFYVAIWQWRSPPRPLVAGFLCLGLGMASPILITFGMGINYFEPSYGVIFVLPTVGPAILSIYFFVAGIILFFREASPRLKSVSKVVVDDWLGKSQ